MTDATKTVSLYDLFGSDTALETEGKWVSIGNTKWRLARAGGSNDKFLKLARQKIQPFMSLLESGDLPLALVNSLMVDCFVETVVLGWEGVNDRSGASIPFTKENVKQVLTELPNLFTEVQKQAQMMGNFKQAILDAAAGN